MKKFLLLTFLMVALSTVVSYGQGSALPMSKVTYYGPSDGSGMLIWGVSGSYSQRIIYAGVVYHSAYEPAVANIRATLFVEYVDGSTFYKENIVDNSAYADILWEGYPYNDPNPPGGGIKKLIYTFEVSYVDDNVPSEIYEVEEI